MSHHLGIWHNDVRVGHVVITNDHQVLAVVIHQPWGDMEIFRSKYPEIKKKEEVYQVNLEYGLEGEE